MHLQPLKIEPGTSYSKDRIHDDNLKKPKGGGKLHRCVCSISLREKGSQRV